MGAPHKNIFKGKKLYARKLDQAKKNERNNGKEKRTTFLKQELHSTLSMIYYKASLESKVMIYNKQPEHY